MTDPTDRARRRPRARALLAALVVVAGGCGLFTDDDPTLSAPPTEEAPERPSVAVLDAGAEPRRQLTLDLQPGGTTELRFSVDLHVTQRGADAERSQVIDPPVTHQTVRFEVVGRDSSGTEVRFEVVDAGIDRAGTALTDDQVLELTAALQRQIGVTGTARIDDRGSVTSIGYEVPDGLPDEAAQALEAMEDQLATVVPALPDEPVGRGARWRTVSRTTINGVTVRQTATYELTGVDGDRLVYRATLSQTAVEQRLDGDHDGPDDEVHLLAADITGSTTGSSSLTELATEAETSLQGSQVVEHRGGAGTERYTQELTATVAMGPAG